MFKRWRKKRRTHDLRYKKYVEIENLVHSSKGNLSIITVNLNKNHIRWLNERVNEGIYSSRSMAIRLAVRDFIKQEEGFIKIFKRKKKPMEIIDGKEYKILGEA